MSEVAAAGIPVVMYPEGRGYGLSLWSVKTRIKVSHANGEVKDGFDVDHRVIAFNPVDAVPKMYSKYSSTTPNITLIVTSIEVVGIEWLSVVDVT